MAQPIELNELAGALDLGDHELIALVGGGGKTTTLLGLGHQLTGRVVLTTTTKTGAHQTDGVTTLTDPTDAEVDTALAAGGPVFARRAISAGKSIGVDPDRCNRWLTMADHVVVEADGAAMRPFTAPRPYEPVVPSATTVLIACIGSDALGRVIADQCHCPLRVAAVARCSPYQRLTPTRAARVLLDERGSRKGCPPRARFVVLVTKVDAVSRRLVDELVEIIGSESAVVAVSLDPRIGPDYRAAR